MEFEAFQSWLQNNLRVVREFQTLGGRSRFNACYDGRKHSMVICRSTGKEGQLATNKIQKIFERFKAGSPSERNMTSFYTDTLWTGTPDRIQAPYVAAIIKAWIKER